MCLLLLLIFSNFFLCYFVVVVVVVVIVVVVVVSSVFKPCLYLYAISTDFFGKKKNLSITPVVEVSFCYHLEETILPGVALNIGKHLTILGGGDGGSCSVTCPLFVKSCAQYSPIVIMYCFSPTVVELKLMH